MVTLSNTPPTPAAFNALRTACGWATIAPDRAARALDASLLHVTALDGDQIVAMGRVVGDGEVYFYVQDIVVAPSHRGQGLGRALIERLLADLKPMTPPGSTIGLMAVQGVEPLYEAAGFTTRPNGVLGAGMTIFP